MTQREILVPTQIHGRVLLRDVPSPRGVLAGFHGYMENAQIQMDRLTEIPDADNWTLVSVQALHRFYRGRSEEVVAGWMTSQDRETAIADNIRYADASIEAAGAGSVPVVYCGFSQGVAMAFRGAVRGTHKAAGIISVGGDVPPELLEDTSAAFPRILLARGVSDEWYTARKMEADLAALAARRVRVESLVYDAAHEWTTEVSIAAARFLSSI